MTALRLEFFKTKRRGLWMIVGALILCEMAWLLWAFRNPDAEDLRLGWMLLLYNIPLLNGIIFPLIAAVLASRLADLEHKSGSLKLLETVQSPRALFTAKYLCGAAYVLAVNLIESAVLLGMGAFYGFKGLRRCGLMGCISCLASSVDWKSSHSSSRCRCASKTRWFRCASAAAAAFPGSC